MKDIINGVAYIHELGEVHRDLKHRNGSIPFVNTLVESSAAFPRDSIMANCGFGLTTEGTSTAAVTTHYGRGTNSYRAPDMIRQRHYNNKVDIWVIGCIFFELLFEMKAFNSEFDVLEYCLANLPYSLPEYSPLIDELQKEFFSWIISDMLEVQPNKRPSVDFIRHKLLRILGVD